jgi:DNA-binding Xre family transcriptional regulator
MRNIEILKKIADEIYEQRRERKAVADQLSWSRQKLHAVLSGKQELKLSEFLDICAILEIEPSNLLK